MANKKTESLLATRISNYMRTKYPDALFQFSIGADVNLPIHIARKLHKINGKWSKGFVDMFIYETNKKYCGFGVEIKADGKNPFKLNGELRQNTHLQTQQAMHKLLEKKGYKAQFVVGYDEAITAIDKYMKIKKK